MANQSNSRQNLMKAFEPVKIPAVDMAMLVGPFVSRRTALILRPLSPSHILSIFLMSSVFLFSSPPTMAQTASGSAAAATKQTKKEQQKAERKARRTKKNAELSKSEKEGFQPGWGNNANYPQNSQDSQGKGGKAPKAGNAVPASAP